MKFDYVKCHGSGNEFVMIDAVANNLQGIDLAELSRYACNREGSIGADGTLLLCEREGVYGMRMFNPDGSEAEMCGNGIRCVARLADELYLGTEGGEFDMWSGVNTYHISHEEDIFEGIPTYAVELAARIDGEVERTIPQLDGELRWTGINVGNPHIIAEVEYIDYTKLEMLGKRVTEIKEVFPQGVNVSLVRRLGANRIFVATFERGAGITASCGTAMTSSATAMALRGRCDYDTIIAVENRGGAVRCRAQRNPLQTQLIGNASYISRGEIEFREGVFSHNESGRYNKEIELYSDFLKHYKA